MKLTFIESVGGGYSGQPNTLTYPCSVVFFDGNEVKATAEGHTYAVARVTDCKTGMLVYTINPMACKTLLGVPMPTKAWSFFNFKVEE